jgi:hypothetical protein
MLENMDSFLWFTLLNILSSNQNTEKNLWYHDLLNVCWNSHINNKVNDWAVFHRNQ